MVSHCRYKPTTFPLSILTNGWFNAKELLPQNANSFQRASRTSIGISAYFDVLSINVYSAEQRENMQTIQDQIYKQEHQLRVLEQSSNTLSLSSNPDDVKQAVRNKIAAQKSALAMIKESAQHHEFAVFETSMGRCAFHLDLDSAADMVALAQGGAVVELVHDETGYAPSLIARTPQPRIKRKVTLPRPKLTPATRSTP